MSLHLIYMCIIAHTRIMLTGKTRVSITRNLFRNPYRHNLIDAAAGRMVVKSQIYCKFGASRAQKPRKKEPKKVVSGESQWAT